MAGMGSMADEGTYHHHRIGACAPDFFAVVNKFNLFMVVHNNHNAFRALGEGNDLVIF